MSMFDIGLSGLRLNNLALTVTAQNTANVNNGAYSRQSIDQSAVVYGTGPYVIGSGVQVDSIRRVADEATNESLRLSFGSFGYASSYSYGMNSIESVFSAEGLSITSGLNDFFASIDEASLTPESVVLRRQIINAADGLAGQFGTIYDQLEQTQSELSQQYNALTESVNASLTSISELNAAIKMANVQGQNTAALQDSLDQQLQNLTSTIGADIVRQSDGTVDVSLSNGQPLVVGENVAQLSVDDSSGSYTTTLNIEFAGQTSSVFAELGGKMGAIADLQANEYEPMKARLDDMVVAFADEVNAIFSTGYDLNGTAASQGLFTYDPDSPASTFAISGITAEQLPLSSDGSVGNGDILTELSQLANKPLTEGDLNGVSIYDAYSQLVGNIGISSLRATANADTALTTLTEAQAARDNISAVSSDEEAANLMMYINAYEANMKVISTANQMFQTVLSAF